MTPCSRSLLISLSAHFSSLKSSSAISLNMTRYRILKFLSSSSVGTEKSDSAESSEIKSESESMTCRWLNLKRYFCRSVNKYFETTSKLRIFLIILVTSSSFYNFFSAKYLICFIYSSLSLSKHETNLFNVLLNFLLYRYRFTISSTIGRSPFSFISFSMRFWVWFEPSDSTSSRYSSSEFTSNFLKSSSGSLTSFF